MFVTVTALPSEAVKTAPQGYGYSVLPYPLYTLSSTWKNAPGGNIPLIHPVCTWVSPNATQMVSGAALFHTCAMVRVKVRAFASVGTSFEVPSRRMPWSSAAPESVARSAEMACAQAMYQGFKFFQVLDPFP